VAWRAWRLPVQSETVLARDTATQQPGSFAVGQQASTSPSSCKSTVQRSKQIHSPQLHSCWHLPALTRAKSSLEPSQYARRPLSLHSSPGAASPALSPHNNTQFPTTAVWHTQRPGYLGHSHHILHTQCRKSRQERPLEAGARLHAVDAAALAEAVLVVAGSRSMAHRTTPPQWTTHWKTRASSAR